MSSSICVVLDMNEERFLKCIVDNNRRQIIWCLSTREMCVNEIIEKLNLEQTLVSFHLKALRNCGLVSSRREGKKSIYRIIDKGIIDILNTINELSKRINDEEKCDECG